MPKNIEELSIFGEYSQVENRVTAALLQIFKIGGESLMRDILSEIGIKLPSSEIEIFSQSQYEDGKSIPDGRLESNFSFRLFIESKIRTKSINKQQLSKHEKSIELANDFLLYITPDDEKPKELENIAWTNWLSLQNMLENYTASQYSSELLEFLVKNFRTLLENNNLLIQSWNSDNNQVLIVAGGFGEDVALNHNVYICQEKSRRSFRPSKFLSFYRNNRIKHLFEIIVEPKQEEFTKEELQRLSSSYKDGGTKTVFNLKRLNDVNIINDKVDKNSKPCPYTYGVSRYVDYDTFIKAKRTSEFG